MESFPPFFGIRAITFSCILAFSFVWLVLLSVEMFTRWGISDRISHSLMILFVLTNTATMIMLPLLILVEFRVWLDAARLFLLLILQVGSAMACTYWNSQIECPTQTPDDLGVCQLINMYTLMACWIIPTILVLYLVYFTVVVWLQSRILVVAEPQSRKTRWNLDPVIPETESPSVASISAWKGKMKETTEAPGVGTSMDEPQKQPVPVPLVLPQMVPRRQSTLPSPSEPTILNPPRRQSTLPVAPMNHSPVPPVPLTQSRHMSLPPPPRHRSGVPHRPMMAVTIPPPLALHAQHIHSPCSSHSSYSNPSPLTAQGSPSALNPGASSARSSYRQSRRHLSMMPLSSSPGEMNSLEEGLLPRTRAKLSKPAPMYLM